MRPGSPPAYWPTLAGWLHLTEPQAGKLWRLVAASHDPQVRAWRLTLGYFHCAPGDRASCQALLDGPLAPRRIIDALEVLVQEGKLSRHTANTMEEAILKQTSAHGAWT